MPPLSTVGNPFIFLLCLLTFINIGVIFVLGFLNFVVLQNHLEPLCLVMCCVGEAFLVGQLSAKHMNEIISVKDFPPLGFLTDESLQLLPQSWENPEHQWHLDGLGQFPNDSPSARRKKNVADLIIHQGIIL